MSETALGATTGQQCAVMPSTGPSPVPSALLWGCAGHT